jgi:hypothetical protein
LDGKGDATGISLYDGPSSFEDIHFDSFPETARPFRMAGASFKTVHSFKRVSFKNSPRKVDLLSHRPEPSVYDTLIEDLDGSISGTGQKRLLVPIIQVQNLMPESHVNGDLTNVYKPNCEKNTVLQAWVCKDTDHALFNISRISGSQVKIERSDGVSINPNANGRYQQTIVLNQPINYTYTLGLFEPPRLLRPFDVMLDYSNVEGKVLIAFKGVNKVKLIGVQKSSSYAVVDSLDKVQSAKVTTAYYDSKTVTVHVCFVTSLDNGRLNPLDGKPWLNRMSPSVRILV